MYTPPENLCVGVLSKESITAPTQALEKPPQNHEGLIKRKLYEQARYFLFLSQHLGRKLSTKAPTVYGKHIQG
jgi:hypothetical protein